MHICFIGDSFVNGYGDPNYQGWPGRICSAASARGRDVTCYNLGIRRNTSRDIAARWRDEAPHRLPQGKDGRLVFSFGANDTVIENGQRRVGDNEALANLQAILAQASTLFPVLMVGPPPVENADHNRRIGQLSVLFQSASEQMGLSYLDAFTPLSQSALWISEVSAFDGAHPRAGGYEELASLVENWLAWQAWFPVE